MSPFVRRGDINIKKEENLIPLTHRYMKTHFSVLVQAQTSTLKRNNAVKQDLSTCE